MSLFQYQSKAEPLVTTAAPAAPEIPIVVTEMPVQRLAMAQRASFIGPLIVPFQASVVPAVILPEIPMHRQTLQQFYPVMFDYSTVAVTTIAFLPMYSIVRGSNVKIVTSGMTPSETY